MTDKSENSPLSPLELAIQRKSAQLTKALFIENTGQLEEAKKLYIEVATEEEWIAAQLSQAGRMSDAAVNLISAASCWNKVAERSKAIALLEEVLKIPDIPDALKAEIIAIRQRWLADAADQSKTSSGQRKAIKTISTSRKSRPAAESLCRGDEDCPPGQRCVNGICTSIPPPYGY